MSDSNVLSRGSGMPERLLPLAFVAVGESTPSNGQAQHRRGRRDVGSIARRELAAIRAAAAAMLLFTVGLATGLSYLAASKTSEA
jgi:hypothetical protein